MIYKVDTREFDNYDDALEYEQELKEKDNKKEKRFKELCDVGNEYIRLRNEYEQDYGKITPRTNFDYNRDYTKIVDDLLRFFY